METNNETVEQKLSEIRNYLEDEGIPTDKYVDIHRLVDEIEYAHKREITAKDDELKIVADHYEQVIECKERLIAKRNVEIANLRALIKEMADALYDASEDYTDRDKCRALVANAREVCNEEA